VLVAVSGGADSVALLHLLRAAPYQIFIGHIDHQLRTGSRRDARFVTTLASSWDLPCRVVKVRVRERAKRARETLEEAARLLRYQALSRMARDWRCTAVLTAHTADDQIETVFMNVLRGAGPAGLSGMPAVRPLQARSRVRLVRPLLGVHRQELRNYLHRHKLDWKEDPSNQDPKFTRNYLRLSVLPLLERRFPGLGKRLLRMAAIFQVF
jgi:tRNA(Ile)-lysidine synthase